MSTNHMTTAEADAMIARAEAAALRDFERAMIARVPVAMIAASVLGIREHALRYRINRKPAWRAVYEQHRPERTGNTGTLKGGISLPGSFPKLVDLRDRNGWPDDKAATNEQ